MAGSMPEGSPGGFGIAAHRVYASAEGPPVHHKPIHSQQNKGYDYGNGNYVKVPLAQNGK